MATRKKTTTTARKAKKKTARRKSPATRRATHKPAAPSASAAPATLPRVTVETTGGPLRLADLKGQNVVIYFYPKDNTPGCTREGCDIRDRDTAFGRRDTVVLGVSRDSLASHERFKTKYSFPFELIADPDGTLCRTFGVIKNKLNFGIKFLGIERSTFLYDKQGRLRREWRGVKVAGHADELLNELDEL